MASFVVVAGIAVGIGRMGLEEDGVDEDRPNAAAVESRRGRIGQFKRRTGGVMGRPRPFAIHQGRRGSEWRCKRAIDLGRNDDVESED